KVAGLPPHPLPVGEGRAVELVANNQARLIRRRAANVSPSPRGRGPTGIELSELRQDRSADFSPPPALLSGPAGSGLKSALLNSMVVGVGGGSVHGPHACAKRMGLPVPKFPPREGTRPTALQAGSPEPACSPPRQYAK